MEKRALILLVNFCVLFYSLCLAKDINFEVSADRNKVALGSTAELYLTFNDTQNIPAVDLPAVDGLQFRYLGPSTRMSVVNGKVSSSITHVYAVFPLKTGAFKIGPLKFNHQSDTYNSNEIQIEVIQGSAPSANNSQAENQKTDSTDLRDKIFLVMEANKNKAYINEIIPVTLKLYVNRLSVRDIQYPEISHDGFSLGEFEKPNQYRQEANGLMYDVIEFNTYIFGLKTGEFGLGPANLKCNLIIQKAGKRPSFDSDGFFDSGVFDNFFGRYESYPLDLKSSGIPITVLPFPDANKPDNFSGTVGEFDLDVTAGPTGLKVGDPITLKMTVKGDGNFNTVSAPKLSSEKDFKAYEPQAKTEKYQKTFEQILMPQNESVRQIPAIYFSFLNTKTGEYQTITKEPIPITVSKPDREEAPKIVERRQDKNIDLRKDEQLGRDIVYIKPSAGKFFNKNSLLYKNNLFLSFHLFPLFGFLFVFLIQKRYRKLKTDIGYARRLNAPRKAKTGIGKAKACLEKNQTKEFYDVIFDTLQEYLGDKFHMPAKGITISVIDESLKHKSIDEGVLAKMKDIFKDCDLARYAASQFHKENMKETLNKLDEVIGYFQRYKIEG